MNTIYGARPYYWGILLSVITFFFLSGCSRGIYELGDRHPADSKYQGVLICGEVITLNAGEHVTETQLFTMFHDAMDKRRQCVR